MDISENGVINENITSTILGLNPIPSFSEHLNIQRDLTILEYAGGKLHIPTISTEKSCELIRNAKKRGLNVSCSTTIHNLFFDDQYSIETSSDGTIRANEKNYLTSRKKFFSCGDSRRGQSLVVWAIKEGRDCALSVHKYLKKKQLTQND